MKYFIVNMLFIISYVLSYCLLTYFLIDTFILTEIIVKSLIWGMVIGYIINLLNYASEDFIDIEEVPYWLSSIMGVLSSFIVFIGT